MNSNISVIVVAKDEKYLIRCLNAVRRQSLKPFEILIATDRNLSENFEDGIKRVIFNENIYLSLNRALESASGDSVFFCAGSSNITNNTLKDLAEKKENSRGILASAMLYIPKENEYTLCNHFLSLYGKLFNLSVIRDNGICFDEKDPVSEYSFMNEYLKHVEGIAECEKTGIYESDKGAFWVVSDRDYMVFDSKEFKADKDGFDENTVRRSYLVKKNEDGICSFAAMTNIWPKPTTEQIERYAESEIERRISEMTPIVIETPSRTVVQEKYIEYTGYMFSAEMPSRALKGEIGLKTIISTLLAWIKHKFKRG
ncbi:MAG: glycosyltransferase family 2 protein [Lachnospiraceae bacterium]|nr:glycosyltransferase family 2 protein [Lachnospiraceae bacterium]